MSQQTGVRRADALGSAASSALFSFALGVGGVVLPLLALSAGYSYGEIGVLTAISGVAQLASRGVVPALGRYLSDRVVVSASGVFMALSCLLIALSAGWVAFIVCQLLQGIARGLFWTGSQLHAVRTESSAFRGIARINLFTSVGLLSGPVTAGLLAEHSLDLALWIACAAGALAAAAAMAMTLLPTLTRPRARSGGPTLSHPAVVFSCLLSAGAGAWSAIMVSFVPVLLAHHQSVAVVGVLIALANGGNAAGSYVSGRVRPTGLSRVVTVSIAANGLCLVLVAFTAASAPLSAVVLVLGGLGAGALVTLGPAVAAATVGEDQQAGAIALAGGARAGALMITPLALGGVVSLAGLVAPVAATGLLLCAPLLWVRALSADHHRPAPGDLPAPGGSAQAAHREGDLEEAGT
jgi:MFS family permease